jgi:hypothetical protein
MTAAAESELFTDNPRLIRSLYRLTRGPLSTRDVCPTAGARNGPDVIYRLRGLGLTIPCKRIDCTDRDGRRTWYGRYSLDALDRRKVSAFLRKVKRAALDKALRANAPNTFA